MNKNKSKKIAIAYMSIILAVFSIRVQTARASDAVMAPLLSAILGTDISTKIENISSHIQQYIAMGKQVVSTYKSAQALTTQVKSFNLSTFAKNLSADQILSMGNVILGVAKGDQGVGINVTTQGNQVITDLKNYIDKTGVNEIKKLLTDIKDPINITPYTVDIQKDIIKLVKNEADKATGNIVKFTLPYIAKSEICNDPDLKKVIKDGEPDTFTKAKRAVANINIDTLCSAASTMTAKDQAVFIGLAKAGYAGKDTALALSDRANTPAGVVEDAVKNVANIKEKAEETTSKQVEATGLTTGQQVCFDKNGKAVKYDPASKNDLEKFCYSQNSTVDQSGTIVKDRNAAALLAPYFSMLSKADSTNNQLKSCKSNGSSAASTTKALSTCLSSASNIMNNLTKIIGMGSSDLQKTFTNEDNAYSRLSDELSGILNTQTTQGGLYADANNLQKDFETGPQEGVYTVDDLTDKIDLYKQIREFNNGKLNDLVYTYVTLRVGIEAGDTAVKGAMEQLQAELKKSNKNPFRSGVYLSSIIRVIQSINDSMLKMKQATIRNAMEIRRLIKEMSADNYKEQQMKKLLKEFNNTDSAAVDNQDSLKSVLGDAKTVKEYTIAQEDWTYVPSFMETANDPTSPPNDAEDLNRKQRAKEEARQAKMLIPEDNEINGPYTNQNMFYLRVRSYRLTKKALEYSSTINFSPTTIKLLSRYGIPSNLYRYSPDLPRGARVTNLIDSDTSSTYSELSYCNNLGISDLICDTSSLTNIVNDFTTAVNNSTAGTSTLMLDDLCINATTTVELMCQDTKLLGSICADPTQKQYLIDSTVTDCQ